MFSFTTEEGTWNLMRSEDNFPLIIPAPASGTARSNCFKRQWGPPAENCCRVWFLLRNHMQTRTVMKMLKSKKILWRLQKSQKSASRHWISLKDLGRNSALVSACLLLRRGQEIQEDPPLEKQLQLCVACLNSARSQRNTCLCNFPDPQAVSLRCSNSCGSQGMCNLTYVSAFHLFAVTTLCRMNVV